ncbi:Virus X resistance protein-like, coiled-coil domain [Sesbania bispinosa]|nr:Virus X resistance protein-like, coiled-coil domain [Sesbania bispinosa]
METKQTKHESFYFCTPVANRISKVLIQESAVLGGVIRHVEWIERELRLMQAFLEVEHGEEAEELNKWAEELKEIARDAEDVIETFVIKSVKRRRTRVLYWLDKYMVGKELNKIRQRMRDISQRRINMNTGLSVTVETPTTTPTEREASSITREVALSIEQLDHIMSQHLISLDKVMEIVEHVKDELGDMQNVVSGLKITSQREKVWLEEVKEVCNYTTTVARNFIGSRERQSKIGKVEQVLHPFAGYASQRKFRKKMEDIRTQIGDALYRSFTYGVRGKERDKQTAPRSEPVPSLSLEWLIIAKVPFFIYYLTIPLLGGGGAVYFLFLAFLEGLLFKAEPVRTAEHAGGGGTKPESNQKKILRRFKRFFRYTLIDFVIVIVSWFLQFDAAIFLELGSLLYTIAEWTFNLWRSMHKNLKSVQRNLALMSAFLSDTQSAQGLNERQKVWVDQLRVVSQNGHSLIAAYPKGKCECFSRIRFAKDINGLLKEILSVSDRKTIYGIADIKEEGLGRIQENERESEIIVEHKEEHPPATIAYRPITGLKEKVQSIKGEMQLMDAMFQDVQEIGELELDGRSRIWVDQMRGIAREIASVMNEYGAKLEHKPILIYTLKYWTRRVIHEKIDEIRNKIKDASRRRKTYGLVQFQTLSSSKAQVQILRARMGPSLGVRESSIVGFDDDVEVLMAQLLSDEEHRCITSIVGIGGTGKTTLARLIFDDRDVVDHFECRVWVSVDSNSTAQQLLQEIAKEAANQIMGGDSWSTTQDSWWIQVLQALAHTKYLIVIDGISIETCQLLDTLQETIPDMSTACRLVLTSRNANVAQHAGTTTFVHPLQLLDDENSWILFTRYLKVDIPSELLKVGKEIVVKCGGLPSEILKMSKLLSEKDVTHEEWSSVLAQLNQDQRPWSETLNTVNRDLPLYLRRCLFYFVLFPAEFGIPVRRLVALWVAESLVHHGEDQEPQEQVAERYLIELIDRNMVQIAKRKHNGKVKTCRLPDALRELWLREANESRFLGGRHTDMDVKQDSIIRRVTDHLNERDIWHNHIHGDIRNASTSLRSHYKDVLSLLSFDTQEGSKPGQDMGNFLNACISSNCFLQLRVLDLERVYKPRLPANIARLSRLRYLGLRWTYLEKLPSSIGSLLKLQTLDLKHTYIHTLPCSIWMMQLRHLYLSETYRSRFPPQPKDEETPVKGGLDRLVNIRKLGLACQSMSSQQEEMIAQLDAVADWLLKLEDLQTLRLKSRDEEGRPWNLHLKSLKTHINLTDMYLLGSLSSSTILSQFPPSLVELTLSHSKLEDDPMQILKDFPHLQSLCLLAESYVGKVLVCKSQSFPQLHVLKFWGLQQLEEWDIEEGALLCLRQLEIRSCQCLKMLPEGLKCVNTLLELKLTKMPPEINVDTHKDKVPPNCKVVRDNAQ